MLANHSNCFQSNVTYIHDKWTVIVLQRHGRGTDNLTIAMPCRAQLASRGVAYRQLRPPKRWQTVSGSSSDGCRRLFLLLNMRQVLLHLHRLSVSRCCMCWLTARLTEPLCRRICLIHALIIAPRQQADRPAGLLAVMWRHAETSARLRAG